MNGTLVGSVRCGSFSVHIEEVMSGRNQNIFQIPGCCMLYSEFFAYSVFAQVSLLLEENYSMFRFVKISAARS